MKKKNNYSAPQLEHGQDTLEDALAGLIASTRRVHRKLNLLEVAHKIEVARKCMRTLEKVADTVGLSSETLRQFLRVNHLCPKVQELLRKGRIQSVDIADRISRLPLSDQLSVAKKVICGELNSDDVRAVVSLRKDLPTKSIKEVIDRVKASRNIKEYVVEFLVPKSRNDISNLKYDFGKIVGHENIRSFSLKKGFGAISLNSAGKNRLQEFARPKGLTKRELVDNIISRRVFHGSVEERK